MATHRDSLSALLERLHILLDLKLYKSIMPSLSSSGIIHEPQFLESKLIDMFEESRASRISENDAGKDRASTIRPLVIVNPLNPELAAQAVSCNLETIVTKNPLNNLDLNSFNPLLVDDSFYKRFIEPDGRHLILNENLLQQISNALAVRHIPVLIAHPEPDRRKFIKDSLEDNQEHYNAFRNFFKGNIYWPQVADSAEQAVDFLKSVSYDIALIAMYLRNHRNFNNSRFKEYFGNQDFHYLLRFARRHQPNSKIVVFDGLRSAQQAVASLRSGANEYVEKIHGYNKSLFEAIKRLSSDSEASKFWNISSKSKPSSVIVTGNDPLLSIWTACLQDLPNINVSFYSGMVDTLKHIDNARSLEALLVDNEVYSVSGPEPFNFIKARHPPVKIGMIYPRDNSVKTNLPSEPVESYVNEDIFKLVHGLFKKLNISRELESKLELLNNKRVLIVDSDLDYIQRVQRDFGFFGTEVDAISNLNEVIFKLQNRAYDLVMVNAASENPEFYRGQRIDGASLADIIKTEYPLLPIITTSKSPFIFPSNHLIPHLQKQDYSAVYRNIALTLFGKQATSSGELARYAPLLLQKFDSEVESEILDLNIDKLEKRFNLEGLISELHNELNHFVYGLGCRDRGYVNASTALRAILARKLICRYESDGIMPDLEQKMWEIYNEKESSLSPVTISYALISAKKALNSGGLKQKRPYCIVLTGPTAAGKTTTAKALEDIFNEDGLDCEWIGNIKTGEVRKGEENLPDVYVKKGDPLLAEIKSSRKRGENEYGSYKSWSHRTNYSFDGKIIRALSSGKNVILIRPVRGIESIKRLLYDHLELDINLISIGLHAPEGVLKERQLARLLNSNISPEEAEIRLRALRPSMQDYVGYPVDLKVSTHCEHSETLNYLREFLESMDKQNMHSIFDSERYLPRVLSRIGLNVFDKYAKRPVLHSPIDIESPFGNIKVLAIHQQQGVCSIYFAPFYNQDSLDIKSKFIDYLQEKLKQSAAMHDLGYNPNSVSVYANTFVKKKLRRGKRTVFMDDIALFNNPYDSAIALAGNSVRSIAFIALQDESLTNTSKESFEISSFNLGYGR